MLTGAAVLNLGIPRVDEDLQAMYLSDKKQGITRDMTDHEELEVLLESFEKQVEEIVNEADIIEVRAASLATCSSIRGLTFTITI